MVFCTEFLDGWWSWEPLRRSCVRCGWCRAANHMPQLSSWWWAYAPETCRTKNTSIKLPCCIKLAFHIISYSTMSILLSGVLIGTHDGPASQSELITGINSYLCILQCHTGNAPHYSPGTWTLNTKWRLLLRLSLRIWTVKLPEGSPDIWKITRFAQI